MALGSKNEAQRRAKVQSKQVGLQSVKHDKNVAGTVVREACEEVSRKARTHFIGGGGAKHCPCSSRDEGGTLFL